MKHRVEPLSLPPVDGLISDQGKIREDLAVATGTFVDGGTYFHGEQDEEGGYAFCFRFVDTKGMTRVGWFAYTHYHWARHEELPPDKTEFVLRYQIDQPERVWIDDWFSKKWKRRKALEGIWEQAAQDPENEDLLPGLVYAGMSLTYSYGPAEFLELCQGPPGTEFSVELYGDRTNRMAAKITAWGECDSLDWVSVLRTGLEWYGYRAFLIDLSGVTGVLDVNWAGVATNPQSRAVLFACSPALESERQAKPQLRDLESVDFAGNLQDAWHVLFGRGSTVPEPWQTVHPSFPSEGKSQVISDRIRGLIKKVLWEDFKDSDEVLIDSLVSRVNQKQQDAFLGFGGPIDRGDVRRLFQGEDDRTPGYQLQGNTILRTTPSSEKEQVGTEPTHQNPEENGGFHLVLSQEDIDTMLKNSSLRRSCDQPAKPE